MDDQLADMHFARLSKILKMWITCTKIGRGIKLNFISMDLVNFTDKRKKIIQFSITFYIYSKYPFSSDLDVTKFSPCENLSYELWTIPSIRIMQCQTVSSDKTYKHNKCHILGHMDHQECHAFQHNRFPAGKCHIHQLPPNTIHFPIDRWWRVTKLKWNLVNLFKREHSI